MATPRKEHLIKTALKLFNQNGFHATGIDRVQAESGVSKTTMYKYFKSKDDLIRAVLEYRHDQFGEWFASRSREIADEKYRSQAHGVLLGMFDTLGEWFQSDQFFGCNFINACAEFSDSNHPIHEYSTWHKLGLKDSVAAQLEAFPENKRDEIAKELLLLIEGAIVCAHTSGLKDSHERAKKMMCLMLDAYLRD